MTVEAEGADFAFRQSDGGDEVLYLGVFERFECKAVSQGTNHALVL